jgi:cGMP-dependent protein kinase
MGCEFCKQPTHIQTDVPASGNVSLAAAEASVDNNNAEHETINFLSRVQLFKRLPRDQLPVLATACATAEFTQGSVLIKQGDNGDKFFVIMKGQVNVSIDGKAVAKLAAGDYVGEMALLRDEPRTATITAESAITALTISRDKFRELGLNEKLEFAKRLAVAGGADGNDVLTKPASNKTTDDKNAIKDALKNNKNLQTVVTWDESKLQAVCDVAWEESVRAGVELIRQGSDEADYFYIVKSGSFDITIEKGGPQSSNDAASGAGISLSASRGDSFGELALMYFTQRAATVKAKQQSVVWVLDRGNFKKILAKSAEDFAKDYLTYLEKPKVFKDLKADERMEVAKALVEAHFNKDDTIMEQGESGDTFYILIEGEVSVTIDGKEVSRLKGSKKSPEVFGERALIKAESRAATIKVVSAEAKTLCMDKTSFDLLLGPLEAMQKRGKDGGVSNVGKGNKEKITQDIQKRSSQLGKKILRKELKRLGLLGCGGFGAVELVEHLPTQNTYALKALSKGYVVKCGMKKSVMSEKNIQYMCDSNFIVRLHETYNGDQSLYFLLELALGGELYATYNKKGFHGSQKHAMFFIGGTMFAFEHLHSKKIIFRDLKPENLLLTETGAVKLTDMGLAKVVVGKTYTTCGTPDYFAPELIASTGHTHAVDWWTLGILTFELMTGHPPFESAAPMQIYSKVTKGIDKVNFPAKAKGPCEDLVKALCKKEPSQRLPMTKGGIENIKKHAWFKGFDFGALFDGTLTPPYQPKVKSKKDIANFSARKEDMPPQLKYKDDGTGWDKDFATST